MSLRIIGISLVLAFAMASLPVMAQSPTFVCKEELSSEQAKKIVNQVQSVYSAVTSLHSKFSQESFLSALEISETSSGEMWFQKPGFMKWAYSQPEEQEFLVRDESVWLYQKNDKQVIVDKFTKILISDLPVAFLLGIGNLSKDFKIIKACENGSGDGYILDLAPKKVGENQKDEGLKAFELVVDLKTYMPTAARVHDIGSNVNTIFLSDIDKNIAITKNQFEAAFPPGTDIDDRRKSAAKVYELQSDNN